MKFARFTAILVLIVAAAAPAMAQSRPAGGGVPAGVRAVRDLEYARLDGNVSLRLDLYTPEKAAVPSADGRPAPWALVVWIHGGGWVSGNKNGCPALVLVPKGFAAASIQYRLADAGPFPAQIHDCKGAIRWLRANAAKYNLDANRIGVWGGSAGGHLVALLGTTAGNKELEGTVGGNLDQSSAVQAVCDFFGPADLTPLGDVKFAPGAAGPVTRLLGGPPSEKKELAVLASPVTHVTKDAAPFLIMHGDKDTTVPHHQSELLNEALKKAGVEVTFKTVEGAGHGFGGPEITKTVQDFFDKHLKAPAK